jgi:hypothetical protein
LHQSTWDHEIFYADRSSGLNNLQFADTGIDHQQILPQNYQLHHNVLKEMLKMNLIHGISVLEFLVLSTLSPLDPKVAGSKPG